MDRVRRRRRYKQPIGQQLIQQVPQPGTLQKFMSIMGKLKQDEPLTEEELKPIFTFEDEEDEEEEDFSLMAYDSDQEKKMVFPTFEEACEFIKSKLQ